MQQQCSLMCVSHVYVCALMYVPTHAPGGLLRKPPLKCAGASCARFPRRSLTRIRPRMVLRTAGLRTWSYGPRVSARDLRVSAIKDLCAREASVYVR